MIKRKYLIATSIAMAMALMLVPSTQASIGLPDYDSGWVQLPGSNPSIRFEHGLNTIEVFVYLIRNTSQGLLGINDGLDPDGLRWYNLTDNDIYVNTMYGAGSHEIRVMIWKIEPTGQVGGLYIPVDKLSLLAPYVALVSTIILAVSISVAYIKHRKKQ